MKFSENLKKLMKTNSLGLKDLSAQLDVAPSTVHGWIHGVPPRNILLVYKLACLFNVSMEELCFNESVKNLDPKNFLETGIKVKTGNDEYTVLLKKI